MDHLFGGVVNFVGDVVGDVVGGTAQVASIVVGGTMSAGGHMVGGTVHTVQIIADGTVHTAQDLVGGTVQAVGNFVNGTLHNARIIVDDTEHAVQIIAEKKAEEVGKPVTSLLAGLTDIFGDESRILRTATGVFTGADDRSRDELIDEVLQRSSGRIKPKTLFEAVKTLMDLIPADMLVKTVKHATRAILSAFISTMGNLPLIKNDVLSNDVNAATLGLIWNNGADLARFLVDLVEPAKCYVRANPQDGTATQDNTHNQFNELDFSKLDNRQAAISQLQRLAKSIIFILSETTAAGNDAPEYIGITKQTELASDINLTSTITIKQPKKGPEVSKETPEVPKEKWFFVNGIAGELFWLRLACKKLADRYGREITGIFNRGDGILWDLVECAGERTAQRTGIAASQKRLVQRTESSKAAQRVLREQLEEALNPMEPPPTGATTEPVVIIAHSQGCLLLRLVLEELVNGGDTGDKDKDRSKKLQEAMRTRLYVFTFGNPSLDWNLERTGHDPSKRLEGQSPEKPSNNLNSYAVHTEHFANKEDFVAKLGVLSGRDVGQSQNSGFPNSSVFINSKDEWQGHLFGAQYSLDDKDYGNPEGKTSWLLSCRPGQPIRRDAGRESNDGNR